MTKSQNDVDLEFRTFFGSDTGESSSSQEEQGAENAFDKFFRESALESYGVDTAALARQVAPVHARIDEHYRKLAAAEAPEKPVSDPARLEKRTNGTRKTVRREEHGDFYLEFDELGKKIRDVQTYSSGTVVVSEFDADENLIRTYAVKP